MPLARMKTWEDTTVPTAVFPFTTDIPLLSAWGQPLLFGPGSILVAAPDRPTEYLDLAELEARGRHLRGTWLNPACGTPSRASPQPRPLTPAGCDGYSAVDDSRGQDLRLLLREGQ